MVGDVVDEVDGHLSFGLVRKSMTPDDWILGCAHYPPLARFDRPIIEVFRLKNSLFSITGTQSK